jgi:hypothetical protein
MQLPCANPPNCAAACATEVICAQNAVIRSSDVSTLMAAYPACTYSVVSAGVGMLDCGTNTTFYLQDGNAINPQSQLSNTSQCMWSLAFALK